MAPCESLTATTDAPASPNSFAAALPTFPNPCTATRAPANGKPSRPHASCATTSVPRAVASCRPALPPMESGLPVATGGAGFAGEEGGDGVSAVHAVRVHDPCHDLVVGTHVRGGNVSLGADEDADLGGEPA